MVRSRILDRLHPVTGEGILSVLFELNQTNVQWLSGQHQSIHLFLAFVACSGDETHTNLKPSSASESNHQPVNLITFDDGSEW